MVPIAMDGWHQSAIRRPALHARGTFAIYETGPSSSLYSTKVPPYGWFGRGEQADLDDRARLDGVVLSAGLTVRELEVVSVITEGASNRDIAHQFSISENTVKHHLTRIFDKVGVSSRLELAVRAAASR